jgi:hypothetical protein
MLSEKKLARLIANRLRLTIFETIARRQQCTRALG